MESGPAWNRMREVFEEAVALPMAARSAYLDRACTGDPDLRLQVDALLASHDSVAAGDPDGVEGGDPEPDGAPASGPPRPAGGAGLAPDPEAIGPYRILERIGDGGFGVVYLAQQTHPIRRRIALKVLRADATSAQVLARFDAERQALALMAHPNIATVHDAGATESGQPYIAMEYVAGAPITRCADENAMRIEDRLQLFVQLCDAVQHAHQKGVIHRDLKPSNVLVERIDGRFVVKVIDFGIAKALDAPLTEQALQTRQGFAIGTPEYMSPEQTGAVPGGVDTRSDVYSLGVLLHELLVGRAPFARTDSSDGALFDLLRRIRDEAPTRLTLSLRSPGEPAAEVARRRHLDVPTLRRRLHGDLEWIVLKALEKDPARRYAAASAFGEDIGHFLANRPVLARPPSATYTIRKLVARHKAVAALGASLAIVLVVFAVAMSVMFARQRVQTLKAERVGAFLEEMLASPDPSNARGQDVLVRDVLNDASDRVRTGLREEPAVQAALQRTMARTYLSLGLSEQADSLARESVATLERIHGLRGHRETAASRRLLGDVLFHRGDYGEAESVLRRTLAEHRAILGEDHEETAASMGLLGDVLNRQGEYEEAEKHLREGLRILGGTAGRETPRYATMTISLGTVLRSLGRYPETEALLREALQIQRKILPEDHPDVTRSMNELAMVLRHEGKFDEAESLYREALAIDERVLGREHPLTAQLMANLGVLLKSRRRYAEAESLYTESLRIRRKVFGDEHPGVATLLNNLGSLFTEQGRAVEAERTMRECLRIQTKAHGEEHPDVALALFNLAGAVDEGGRPAEAAGYAERALEMRRKLLGADHPDVAAAAHRLGAIRRKQGREAEALPLLQAAHDIRATKLGSAHHQTAASAQLLGECLLSLGRAADAESLLTASVAVILASEAMPTAAKRRAIVAMAALADSLRRPEEAARWRAQRDSLPVE